jgi:hypothetical protein
MSQKVLPSSLNRSWRALRAHHPRSGLILLLLISALLVFSVGYAIEAENPWGKTVAKRVAQGKDLDVREYRIIGLWWASLASAGLSLGLLGTARWWLPLNTFPALSVTPTLPLPAEPGQAHAATAAPARWWFWAALGAAVLLGAWEREPRLHHSFWNDEEYSLRSYTHGEWKLKDGELQFDPLLWEETLFNNQHGNNHVFTAAASRISLTCWRWVTGAPESSFSEAVVRLPSFVSSLGTILLVGWLGMQMGGPAVGIAAAALLAISPWHIRYSAESKGYATMMLFMVASLAGALLAVRTDKLRWWLLFALAEAGYLLCFAGSIYLALVVNALLTLAFFVNREPRRIFTLIAVNLVAALPVIWWMSPSVPQIAAYLRSEDSPRLEMGWPWICDLLAGLSIGWGYGNPQPELHLGTSWLQESGQAHWAYRLLMQGALPVLGMAGFVAALRLRLAAGLGVVAVTLAAALSFGHNAVQNNPMWVWYLNFTVIPMALALPLGIGWITRCCARAGYVLMGALFVALLAATWGPTNRMRIHDRQPIRQTIAQVRGEAPTALTATFGVSDRQAKSYDPPVRVLKDAGDLEAALAEARQTGLPLYVYVCGESVTADRHPDLMNRIKNAAEFERGAYLPGTEAMFSYQIYRAKAGAAPPP